MKVYTYIYNIYFSSYSKLIRCQSTLHSRCQIIFLLFKLNMKFKLDLCFMFFFSCVFLVLLLDIFFCFYPRDSIKSKQTETHKQKHNHTTQTELNLWVYKRLFAVTLTLCSKRMWLFQIQIWTRNNTSVLNKSGRMFSTCDCQEFLQGFAFSELVQSSSTSTS